MKWLHSFNTGSPQRYYADSLKKHQFNSIAKRIVYPIPKTRGSLVWISPKQTSSYGNHPTYKVEMRIFLKYNDTDHSWRLFFLSAPNQCIRIWAVTDAVFVAHQRSAHEIVQQFTATLMTPPLPIGVFLTSPFPLLTSEQLGKFCDKKFTTSSSRFMPGVGPTRSASISQKVKHLRSRLKWRWTTV